jgi:hypothetical protein
LYEAALSGNVTAIQLYLSNKAPEKWAGESAPTVEAAYQTFHCEVQGRKRG